MISLSHPHYRTHSGICYLSFNPSSSLSTLAYPTFAIMEDEDPRIWFQSGIKPGTIITLDQPVRSQWKIVEKLNEHSTQRSQAEHDHYGDISIASTKILCQSSTDRTKKAYMRIVQQIPIQTPNPSLRRKYLGRLPDIPPRAGCLSKVYWFYQYSKALRVQIHHPGRVGTCPKRVLNLPSVGDSTLAPPWS